MPVPVFHWRMIGPQPNMTKKHKPPGRPRVYMRGGVVAHLLAPYKSPNSNEPALCGRMPWPTLWRGTGNQTEHDKAKALRLCLGCKAAMRQPPEEL